MLCTLAAVQPRPVWQAKGQPSSQGGAHRGHLRRHAHAKGVDGGILVELGVLLHAVLDPPEAVARALRCHLEHLRLLHLVQLHAAPLPPHDMAHLQRQPDVLVRPTHVQARQPRVIQPGGWQTHSTDRPGTLCSRLSGEMVQTRHMTMQGTLLADG